MPLLLGVACGSLAALPYVMCRGRGLGAVIGAVLASFALFHAGIAALYVFCREGLVPAATLAVASFLAVIVTSCASRGT